MNWNAGPAAGWRAAERTLARFPSDAKIALYAASMAKEVDPASALAPAARAREVSSGHPKALAWATYVLAFAHRWLGNLEQAKQHAAQLVDGIDSLAGPEWTAWGHFETAANSILRGELELGVSRMEAADDIFSAIGSRFKLDGKIGCAMSACASRDLESADHHVSRAEAIVNEGSRGSQYSRELLDVARAECDRLAGEDCRSLVRYHALAGSEVVAHRTIGLLGIADIARRRDQGTAATWTAFRSAKKHGFRYGCEKALTMLALSGEVDPREINRLATESDVSSPERHPPLLAGGQLDLSYPV